MSVAVIGGGNAEKISLPLILLGERLDQSEQVDLEFENGERISVGRFSEHNIRQVQDSVKTLLPALNTLTIQGVTGFLSAVGAAWLDEKSYWRRFALAHAPRLTGYPTEMLASDYFMIGEYMRWRTYVYDQVASELGHEHIFDDWIPLQASYVKAFGLGLAVHLLVGNLPLAGMYSVLRSIVSRNVTLAKLPVRDPISTYSLVATMLDVDPDHPISRSLSLGYWPHGDRAGKAACGAADVICTWGGATAIEATRALASPDARLLDFGPKWSAAAVDLLRAEPAEAAYRLASEASFYDQEACFSPQRVFIRGDVDSFLVELKQALARFAARMPLETRSRDVLAHRSIVALEAEVRGWDVTWVGTDALILVVPEFEEFPEHPLTRTVVLHPVEGFDEVTPYLDHRMQTMSVFPWALAQERKDEWAMAGASRLVELGMSRHPRHGFSHDGMRWLNQMVRLVSLERSTSEWYKYGDIDRDLLLKTLFIVD